MALIENRKIARQRNDQVEEKRFRKEVRRMARKDRTVWMDRMIEDGSWEQIKKLRRPRKVQHGRLCDSQGKLVESDQWSNTMADYLASVQWRVRPPGLVDGAALGQELPVLLADFSSIEVKRVIEKLRKKKATGPMISWLSIGRISSKARQR